jgi:hypothetical protein
MDALSRMGVDPVPFDVLPYEHSGSRVERILTPRIKAGPAIIRLNRALQRLAKAESFDAVWVDKGIWIWPDTLLALRSDAKRRFAVHYTPDAAIFYYKSRHFVGCIPHYDLLVTTKPFETGAYKMRGAKRTLLVLQGYGKQFTPGPAVSEFRSGVCFIGNCHNDRMERIKAVARASNDIAVWGDAWVRAARFNSWLRPFVRGKNLWGEGYPAALRSAKIVLGLLIKAYPETTTTRTFEIPATGTFMLAERTDDHLSLFDEGKEAEFFSSNDEMVDKIRFYLAHDEARARVAAAGRERCLKSGYSDENQLRKVIAAMQEVLPV